MHFIRHWFTPHHTNNHKARILHPTSLAILLTFLLIVQFGLHIIIKAHQPDILGIATNVRAEEILRLTNEERLKKGLKPLHPNPLLTKAAQAKAEYMFKYDFWAHTAPDGTTPWYFINQAGYSYLNAGENLAKEFDQSKNVVKAWMASSTHRANILRSDYQDIGLAVVNGKLNGEETTLVVQMFGTRQPQLIASEETEKSPATVSSEPTSSGIGGVFTYPSNSTVLPLSAFNIFYLIKISSLLLGFILFFVFAIDGIVIWRRGVTRVSSRNLAHGIFLASLLAAIWFTGLGAIL